MDHPHLMPRDMLHEICGILGRRWDRKVSPDEIGMEITMERRYPLFVAFITSYKGEPAGTPTQSIDNLLNLVEEELVCPKCGGERLGFRPENAATVCNDCGHLVEP